MKMMRNSAMMGSMLLLALIAAACSRQSAQVPQVLVPPPSVQTNGSVATGSAIEKAASIAVETDGSQNTVIRLLGKQNSAVWKIRDDRKDIVVTTKTNGTFRVDARFIRDNGATSEIHTEVEALPGEQVLLGGSGGKKILLQSPKE
jgi:hypothetical protein